MYILLAALLLAGKGHAQVETSARQPHLLPSGELPTQAPSTFSPKYHVGGYSAEGLHFTVERLAPPPSKTPYAATPTQLDVAVSDSSTTYLVFPGAVSLVDVGMMDNYLIKMEGNSVFIRARTKKAPPTPVMVRHGNRYWMGRLVTVRHAVMTLYDFTKPGALNPPAEPATLTTAQLLGPDAIVAADQATDVAAPEGGLQTSAGTVLPTTSTGVGPDNDLALDRERSKKARITALLHRLDQYSDELHSVAVVDNRLAFSLVNVRNDKQFSYLRFKLVNNSSIDYEVDFADFTLVENSKRRFLGKKKNEARRPMMPAGGHPNQRIAGNSTGYIYYAVPLFAATNEGHLSVGLRELSGARAIQLDVPSRVINTAPTFHLTL